MLRVHAVTLSASVLCAIAGSCVAQNTDRVSTNGVVPQNGFALAAQVTPDGRFAVFSTYANNIVAGDTNNSADIFVRDRLLNTVARISVPDASVGEAQAGGNCFLSERGSRVISDDGRFVAFISDASNLVNGDTNGAIDGFVRDRDLDQNGVFDETGAGKTRTTRVTLSSSENQALGNCPNGVCDHDSYNLVMSASGRYVAWESQYDFTTDSVPYNNIYWRDRDADNDGIFDETGGNPDAARTVLVSVRTQQSLEGIQGDGYSTLPAISADGQTVAFVSLSRYLVQGDSDSNLEIFARLIPTNTTVRITAPLAGGQPSGTSSSPTVSANGRFVAFHTGATNLDPSVNGGFNNVIIKDRDADNDGIYDEAGEVTFRSASKGFNPFLLGSPIVSFNGESNSPSISDDGSKVAFNSFATNYFCSVFDGCIDTNNVSDVFVFDSATGRANRVSVGSNNQQATANSDTGIISGNGRFVSFVSLDANLDNIGSGLEAYVRAIEANDNGFCSTALPVTNGTFFGDTWGTFDNSLPMCVASSSSAVWYSYTASCTGSVRFDTDGSLLDTVLSIYDGACPGTGTSPLACDDDSGSGTASLLNLNVVAGHTYRVRVGGFGFAAGFFQLNIGPCAAACPADINGDGGVDGDDVIAFFTLWDNGDIGADFNGDEGVDGDDVIAFFERWDAGC